MKKLFYLAVVITASLISSCTPDSPVTTTINGAICPQPKLQFKGNGTLYVCDAVSDSRLGWIGFPRIYKETIEQTVGIFKTRYVFTFCNTKFIDNSSDMGSWVVNFPSTQNSVKGDFMLVVDNTPNFNVGSYTTDDLSMHFINLSYNYQQTTNNLVFNINSISNGLASGTFSGSIPRIIGNPSNEPQMNITEGVFSNIPVFE